MSGSRARQQRRAFDRNLIATGARLAGRVIEDVPFCWMCSADEGQRAKEHIFPQWLQRHHRAENEQAQPHRIRAMTGEVLSDRGTMPVRALLAGEVCSACNNGWMSALERDVQPLLKDTPTSGEISSEDRLTLARWFTKTAICLNISQPYRLCLDAPTRHEVRSGMPDGVIVLLSRITKPNGIFNWIQRAPDSALLPSEQATDVALLERCYVAHIQIDTLVGTVVYVPEEIRPAFVDEPDAAVIWPPPETPPTWELPQNDSLPIFVCLVGD